jgi:exonuclease III
MFERPLTLASLNVRGLRRDSPKPKEIKAWMVSFSSPPQVLLIQEHHLGKEEIQNSAKGLEFWNGTVLWNEGIPMGRSQRISAGTAILINRVTTSLIKDHGTLMEGCAQYVSFQSPEGGTLTIINVYAQRSSSDRALLWQKITQVNFTADHVVVGGDFNHLEETTRRGIFGERQIHRREASTWHQMTLRYGLADAWRLDSFRKMSKKNFTFDNGRSGAHSAVFRIDKFLVSQEIEERGGRMEAATSIRKLSNHSPLIITICGHHPPPNNPSRFFDATLFSDDNCRIELLKAWSGDTLRPTNGRDSA